MCARYEINLTAEELDKIFKIDENQLSQDITYSRILPKMFAPVILKDCNDTILRDAMFTLKPNMPKYASFNFRLDRADSPFWSGAVEKRRCLIPMTEFFEPIYIGPKAGHWVGFKPEKKSILMAAGIWTTTVDKNTGQEFTSFAMGTVEPFDEVKKNGHPRSPAFLTEKGWLEYLDPKIDTVKKVQKFVDEFRPKLELSSHESEAMKPGWEKRIPKD